MANEAAQQRRPTGRADLPVRRFRKTIRVSSRRLLRLRFLQTATRCPSGRTHKNILKVPAADVLPAVSVAKTSMRLWPKSP